MFRLYIFTALFAILAVANALLSVEVKIKQSNSHKFTCKGVITFLALDTDCADCLYGVKDLNAATVQCKSASGTENCCKSVIKKW